MKKLSVAVALGVVVLSGSTEARADCNTVGTVVTDIFAKWKSLDKAAGKIDEMIAFWNKMAGNSWAHIGPRRLDYATTLEGTVQSVGDRTFIAPYPGSKSYTLELTKEDGKGTAEVTICTQDSAGKKTAVRVFTIDKDDPNEKKWTQTIDGNDKVVYVVVNGKNVVRSVEYKLVLK